VFDHVAEPDGSILAATHADAERALVELQGILSEARLNDTSVAWLTSGAVSTGPEEGVSGLSRAPLWGLVRSARAEHPDRRLQLVDVDSPPAEAALLAKLLSMQAEPELALRHGSVVAPRLVRAGAEAGALQAPAAAQDYRAAITHPGRLDGVSLVAAPELSEPLAPGHIRVSVRAAGMNFRDVLIALGQIESPGIGFEFAGVVEAVCADVTSVSVGDRVFGFGLGCFGTRAVTAAQLIAKVPAGMSFEAAATVPLAYLTALYALQDLGQVKAGERVLVHAAAGGVGMAAVQLCRHFGAEVYGTASAGKWSVLEKMGLDARHIASSRDLSFETQFLSATDGKGVDVVLNSLTGEFVDASLRLLPRGIFKQRQSLRRILLPQQKNAAVQRSFIKAGLELQGLAVLGNPRSILLQKRVGHRQIEVREVILGVNPDGFGEGLHRELVLAFLQRLHAFGCIVGLKEKEECR
jgi:hypothetical protein